MTQKDTTFLLQAICRIKEFYGQTKISELCASDLLIENLGLDSLQIAELSVLIEAEYGFDVFSDGMLATVGDLISKIELNQQSKETAG